MQEWKRHPEQQHEQDQALFQALNPNFRPDFKKEQSQMPPGFWKETKGAKETYATNEFEDFFINSDLLGKVTANLQPRDKRAIALRFNEGKTDEEIAEILAEEGFAKVTPGTVKVRIERALRSVRPRLEALSKARTKTYKPVHWAPGFRIKPLSELKRNLPPRAEVAQEHLHKVADALYPLVFKGIDPKTRGRASYKKIREIMERGLADYAVATDAEWEVLKDFYVFKNTAQAITDKHDLSAAQVIKFVGAALKKYVKKELLESNL